MIKIKFLRRLYDCILRLSQTKYAFATLLFVSFFGSSFFPFPTEIIMIPMILAKPQKALYISTVALVSSVLGGISAYYIGALLFDSVGRGILETFGYMDSFNAFSELYTKWGYWIVFAGGLTPFPYKVICIASGVVSMNLSAFIIASTISRAIRYYFIAFLLYKYGERANAFIEKHLETLTIIAFILVLLAVSLVKGL